MDLGKREKGGEPGGIEIEGAQQKKPKVQTDQVGVLKERATQSNAASRFKSKKKGGGERTG